MQVRTSSAASQLGLGSLLLSASLRLELRPPSLQLLAGYCSQVPVTGLQPGRGSSERLPFRPLTMADHLPPDDLADASYLPAVAESGNDWRKSAGDFACAACGKKRLTAMSFSKSQVKKMLAQHKAGGELSGRCLECQPAEPEPEPSPATPPPEGSAAAAESLRCTGCKADKPPAEFSRKMLTRPKEKRRCKDCVEGVQAAEQAKKAAKDAANPPRSQGVGGASVFGTGAARGMSKENAFRAAMEETAAEAQAVTGISVKRGRGGGRGAGRRGGARFGNSALRRGPSNALKK